MQSRVEESTNQHNQCPAKPSQLTSIFLSAMASKRLRCRTSTLGSELNDICLVLQTEVAEHESHAMRTVRFSLAANLAKQSVMLRVGPGAAALLLLPPRLPPIPPDRLVLGEGDDLVGDDFVFPHLEAAAAAAAAAPAAAVVGGCACCGGGDDLPPGASATAVPGGRPALSSENVVDAGEARPVLGVVA